MESIFSAGRVARKRSCFNDGRKLLKRRFFFQEKEEGKEFMKEEYFMKITASYENVKRWKMMKTLSLSVQN